MSVILAKFSMVQGKYQRLRKETQTNQLSEGDAAQVQPRQKLLDNSQGISCGCRTNKWSAIHSFLSALSVQIVEDGGYSGPAGSASKGKERDRFSTEGVAAESLAQTAESQPSAARSSSQVTHAGGSVPDASHENGRRGETLTEPIRASSKDRQYANRIKTAAVDWTRHCGYTRYYALLVAMWRAGDEPWCRYPCH